MDENGRQELAALIEKYSSNDGLNETPIPGVVCYRETGTERLTPSVYDPSLCVIARSNFHQPIRVQDLAELAGMSASSFHAHFKSVTAMSPLQFQKHLRLMEARQIMLSGQEDAASTAYRVGYESPSQFSREYARMFGNPPARDINMLRQQAPHAPAAAAVL